MQFSATSIIKYDRRAISKRWKRDNRNPLNKAGALTRGISIRSIRKDRTKKRGPSKPGRPPKSRAEGHPLRLIFFSVAPLDTSAIVGPVGLGGKSGATVPEIHEKGGTFSRKVFRKKAGRRRAKSKAQAASARRLYKAGRIKPAKAETTVKPLSYQPRPFMVPALAKVKDRLPQLWRHFLRN